MGSSDDPTRTAESTLPPPVHPAEPVPPLPVRDRGRYEVVAEHGRGGLGRVSRARDNELGRDVAIKELIKRGDTTEMRFMREALITARLEHPGIVPVHDAGYWADGTPFYAMKLVSGRQLKQLIEECATAHARLALLPHVIAVADAIAYAHGRRIIHRDLKPGNVVVGDFGETIVIDWGLAKDLSDLEDTGPSQGPERSPGSQRSPASSELTATGNVLGTPAYMAPEQARGEPVDERVDVFAIGAMLWELCTRTRVPPEPHRRHRLLRREGIDRDLATIIVKALAPAPADRYPHAAALATDLKAFQAGARIAARNYSLLAMVAHWTRRQRRLAITIAAATAVAIIAIVWFVSNIAAERDRADASAIEAHAQQRRAEQITSELTLQHAELQLRSDPTATFATLATYRGDDVSRLRRLRAKAVGRGVATASFRPHGDQIWYLTNDPSGAILSAGSDRALRLTRGGESTTLATNLMVPASVAYARDANLFAYATAPSGLALLSLTTRATTAIDTRAPFAMDITPDGSRLAAVTSDGTVAIWSLAPTPTVLWRETIAGVADVDFADRGRVVMRERGGALRTIWLDPPRAAAPVSLGARRFDVNERQVVTGDDKGNLVMLSPELQVLARASVCGKEVNAVNAVPGSDLIAFACEDASAGVARHDAAAGSLTVVDRFPTAERAYRAIPDASGKRVVVCDDSSVVYVYDVATRLITRYEGLPSQTAIAGLPATAFDHIVVGDVNGNVRVWDPPRRDARVVLQAQTAVFAAAFSPDGAQLATGDANGVVRTIRLSDGAITELRGHSELSYRVRFSPDGRFVMSFSADGTVRVWRAADGALVRVLADHAAPVLGLGMIEAGRRVVSIGNEGRLLAWTPDGTDVAVLHAGSLPLTALEVLGHTDRVVVRDASNAIWEVAPGGAARQVRPGDDATVTVLRASLDGRLVATGTERGSVVVYDTTAWTTLHTVSVRSGVRQLRFDPRNRDLIILSSDGGVRALALGAPRMSWHDIPLSAINVDYAPDGETVAFVTADGGAWFYGIRTDTWAYTLDHASETFVGTFSPDGALFASTDRRGLVTIRDVAATLTAAAARP